MSFLLDLAVRSCFRILAPEPRYCRDGDNQVNAGIPLILEFWLNIFMSHEQVLKHVETSHFERQCGVIHGTLHLGFLRSGSNHGNTA